MKKAKILHAVQIVVLFLLTAVISFTVVQLGRTAPVSAPADVTTAPDLSQQSGSGEQTEPSWLPEIEYDAYTPSEIAQENFRAAVILGNSQAQALSNFGLIKDADFVTRVGLQIHQVLTSKTGAAPIAQLYGKRYEKAVFIFGENELGWPYPQNFITHYKKVIAKVRELNPGVEVYCQAIFPVTAERSATSDNGITNENVRLFNEMLEKMCAEIDAHFMPVSDAFFDRTGVLPANAATDGVHFGYDYCKIWAGDLSAYLQTQTPETEISEPETTVTEISETATMATTATTEEGVTQQ